LIDYLPLFPCVEFIKTMKRVMQGCW